MSKLETMILSTSKYLGVNHIYKKLFPTNTVVLMYHGVSEDNWDISNGNWLQVTKSSFRKQMEFLKTHYQVVTLDEAIGTIGERTKKPKVTITFDDGYANNYIVAYPILKELDLPATIFLVSDMIGTDNLFWYDKLRTSLKGTLDSNKIEEIIQSFKTTHPHKINNLVDEFIDKFPKPPTPHIKEAYGILTLSQIKEMQDSGLISFDSHTHRHEILNQLVNEEPDETIGSSLTTLRGYGIKCGNVFCYPNGLYNNNHFNVLKRHGFKAATSTIVGEWTPETHQYEIPRYGVGRQMTQIQFEHLMTGLWKTFGNVFQFIKHPLSFSAR